MFIPPITKMWKRGRVYFQNRIAFFNYGDNKIEFEVRFKQIQTHLHKSIRIFYNCFKKNCVLTTKWITLTWWNNTINQWLFCKVQWTNIYKANEIFFLTFNWYRGVQEYPKKLFFFKFMFSLFVTSQKTSQKEIKNVNLSCLKLLMCVFVCIPIHF